MPLPLMPLPQVGDYLLTLPHQLEPFTSQDNPALNHALQQGVLPFPDDMALSKEEEGEPHPSTVWLGAVARGTMATYTQQILHIPSLPPPAAQQLATDIGEDIPSLPPPAAQQLATDIGEDNPSLPPPAAQQLVTDIGEDPPPPSS
jgi:hypothetical protein